MADRRRGQIIPRGDKKYLIRVYVGTDANGKRQYDSKTITGTIKQAQNECTAMLRNVDTREHVRPSKLTLKEYLGVPDDADAPSVGWLASKIDISPRSQVGYRAQLSHVVRPIGHLRLTELDSASVQHVVNLMAAAGLSPRTVEYTYRVLHSALHDAVKQRLLLRNPADHVKLPKKIKRAPSVLTMKQVGLFLEATKDDREAALWRLMLTSGLRPQEAFALKWTDIDMEGCWVAVQRTLVDDGYGSLSLVESGKTDGSMRRIGLPESTIESLRAQKARQAAEILLAGPKYQRLDLVFANTIGTPLDFGAMRRRWWKALKKAGLPRVRMYDTRHSHATALLQNGADLAWVASRLGHTGIQMTQQHYAHVLPETHRKMGEMTEQMMKEAASG